jgi:hypothetical protein
LSAQGLRAKRLFYGAALVVACARSIAHQWNWPLFEHPQVCHDLPLDDGKWAIDQIRGSQSGLGASRPVP